MTRFALPLLLAAAVGGCRKGQPTPAEPGADAAPQRSAPRSRALLETLDRGVPPRRRIACRLAEGVPYDFRLAVDWQRGKERVTASLRAVLLAQRHEGGLRLTVSKLLDLRPEAAMRRVLRALASHSWEFSETACRLPRDPLGLGATWRQEWATGSLRLSAVHRIEKLTTHGACVTSKLRWSAAPRNTVGGGTAQWCIQAGALASLDLETRLRVVPSSLDQNLTLRVRVRSTQGRPASTPAPSPNPSANSRSPSGKERARPL